MITASVHSARLGRSIPSRALEHQKGTELNHLLLENVSRRMDINYNVKILAKSSYWYPGIIWESLKIMKKPNNFKREDGYHLRNTWRLALQETQNDYILTTNIQRHGIASTQFPSLRALNRYLLTSGRHQWLNAVQVSYIEQTQRQNGFGRRKQHRRSGWEKHGDVSARIWKLLSYRISPPEETAKKSKPDVHAAELKNLPEDSGRATEQIGTASTNQINKKPVQKNNTTLKRMASLSSFGKRINRRG